MRNWLLRSEQFGALWAATGQDRQPFPFTLVSPARTYNAFEHEQQQIREAFAGEDRQNVRTAVRVLAEPEVFVEISGETVDEVPIRIIGAGLQRWCAVAVQRPGATPAVGGDVILGAGITDDLASVLIGLIPQNAAGRRTFARRDEPEPDYFSQGILRSAGAAPPARKLENAMRKGHAGSGTIRVLRGPRHVRGELGTMRWIDISGDGRYLIGPRDPNAAAAAGPELLVSALSAAIGEGLRLQRETAEHRW
ncbi:ESX secretion-associated protein EspG [Rhodococcus marinonascens]|uniref:ESX secretion-associated protein EspG n=1 Tax=Rhodococcus marinonascens TaxID=38311 RepID=UPI00093472EC|nr:ESX secretion-associated protein EspG [Rhodococcus marinonascens]